VYEKLGSTLRKADRRLLIAAMEAQSSSKILDQVRSVAADVLGVTSAGITPESSPQTLESWDSVHHLNLVLALEEKFSIQFSPEEIDAMHNIGDIVAVIQAKGSASHDSR
jgi:acyl carrier protein